MAHSEGVWIRDTDGDVEQKIDAAQEARGGNRSDAIRSLIRDAPAPNEHTSGCKRHLQAVYAIEIDVAPFEATAIGNRLWHLSERLPHDLEDECKWLARRFHETAAEAANPTDILTVHVSEFEARVIGNRLNMVGKLYDDDTTFGDEAQQIGRRFHGYCTTRTDGGQELEVNKQV